MLSDLWSPIGDVQQTIAQLSATGAHGHVVQIVDPAEESFPYSGRVEFIEPEGGGCVTAGRAETWRNDYQGLVRVTARKSAPRPTGWAGASPSTAPTGRPANYCSCCIRAWAPICRRHRGQPLHAGERWESGMIGRLAARLRAATGAARPARPAGFVVAVAAGAAASAPHQLPAHPAAVRDRAQRGNPVAHAVVADPAAADARRHWSSSPPPVRCGIRRSPRSNRGAPLAGHARRRLGRGGLLGRPAAHRRRNPRARRCRQSRRRACCRCRRPRAIFRCRSPAPRACDSTAQAEALHGRPHRSAALARAFPQGRAGRRDRLALRRRRSRQRRRIHRRL